MIINSAEGELENGDIYQDNYLPMTMVALIWTCWYKATWAKSIKTAWLQLKQQVSAGMENVTPGTQESKTELK